MLEFYLSLGMFEILPNLCKSKNECEIKTNIVFYIKFNTDYIALLLIICAFYVKKKYISVKFS